MASNTAIEVKGFGKRFGREWAVRGLDLKVPRGCIYGFLGLNGAGKSTTIRALLGLLTADEGQLSIDGRDPILDRRELLENTGYVPDAPLFHEWMTVGEIVAYVAHERRSNWDFKRAAHLLRTFNLDPRKKVKSLSKGQRTRVSLLLALAFNPSVLILDEPTGGLDPVMRREVLETVLDEYLDGGERTVLISSHLINEIAGLVDRVGILHEGKLLREGTVEHLRGNTRRVRAVYTGDVPRGVHIPGLLRGRARGREWVFTVENYDQATLHGILEKTGPEQVIVEELNLEDIFIDHVHQGGGGEA